MHGEPAISSKEQADAEFLLSKITEEAERLKKQKQDMQEHHEKQLEALQKESERMAKELEMAEKNRMEAERTAKGIGDGGKESDRGRECRKSRTGPAGVLPYISIFFLISNFKTIFSTMFS